MSMKKAVRVLQHESMDNLKAVLRPMEADLFEADENVRMARRELQDQMSLQRQAEDVLVRELASQGLTHLIRLDRRAFDNFLNR